MACHYLWVAERVADGNITVQCHDQEDVAVKDNEEVDAEHLEQATSQRDAVEACGEAEEHGRHHGGGGTDVDSQEQGNEQVHGLVQAALGYHSVDDQGIGGEDHQVEAEEGQHQEDARLPHPWEAHQEEAAVGTIGAAIAPPWHHPWGSRMALGLGRRSFCARTQVFLPQPHRAGVSALVFMSFLYSEGKRKTFRVIKSLLSSETNSFKADTRCGITGLKDMSSFVDLPGSCMNFSWTHWCYY